MIRRVVKERLASTAGLTLGELLVSVVVMSLVSLLLAAGVSVAARQYQESLVGSESQALCSTLTTAVTTALRSAQDFDRPSVTSDQDGEHYVYQRFWAADAYRTGLVVVGEEGQELPEDAAGYVALKATDGSLAPLATQASYTLGMKARVQLDWTNGGSSRYSAEAPVCKVTLTVCDSASNPVATSAFTVIPVNS
ncbi:MAG: hypothetical protein PUA57_00755 [Eggerthellales bacterium]|nr:hypothetical protein [Eggerthellales bacterium]